MVLVLLFVATSVISSIIYLYTPSSRVQAATNSTINFQARILTNTGALVPDGYYNVEFKLYTASSGGSTVWTKLTTTAMGQLLVTITAYRLKTVT